MTLSDEKLTAFMDGELDEAEMEEIAQALESDDALVERLIALREADSWLRTRYDALDDKPISAVTEDTARQLVEKLGEATPANVLPLTRTPKKQHKADWRLPAIAASVALLVGLGTGQLLSPALHEPSANDPLLAAGPVSPESPLFAALEHSVSGSEIQPGNGGTTIITPLSLFETRDGHFCREYQVSGTTMASRGLACRQTGTWTVAISLVTPRAAQGSLVGDYATASTGATSAIDTLIMEKIAGDILTQDDERALLEKWSN